MAALRRPGAGTTTCNEPRRSFLLEGRDGGLFRRPSYSLWDSLGDAEYSIEMGLCTP